MTIRDMICVACPMGCGLHVTLGAAGEVQSVSGNTCKRGESYARAEVSNPTRSFTSTVRVLGGDCPLVSVKSAKPIPKGKMMACAQAIQTCRAAAPIAIGDVLLPDILGTGVDVIATNRVAVKG
jgi:CxxC motif-containing protein